MEEIEMNHKITITEQLNYIFITLKETLNICGMKLTNATLLHFRRTFIQS